MRSEKKQVDRLTQRALNTEIIFNESLNFAWEQLEPIIEAAKEVDLDFVNLNKIQSIKKLSLALKQLEDENT